MSGKEAMMEGATAGRQGARPKRADVPAAAGGEAQNDAVARRIRQADDENDPEQDRLTQVGRHGTAPHGGGQPTQSRQPAVLPGPTGI